MLESWTADVVPTALGWSKLLELALSIVAHVTMPNVDTCQHSSMLMLNSVLCLRCPSLVRNELVALDSIVLACRL